LENQKNKQKQQPFIDLDDFENFISEFNKQQPSTSKQNELICLKHNWNEWHFLTPTNCFFCNKKVNLYLFFKIKIF
jgi:hypothetical protein